LPKLAKTKKASKKKDPGDLPKLIKKNHNSSITLPFRIKNIRTFKNPLLLRNYKAKLIEEEPIAFLINPKRLINSKHLITDKLTENISVKDIVSF